MKKLIQRIIKLIIAVIVLVALYLAVVIIIGTITDYRPDDITELEIAGNPTSKIFEDSTFTFLSWNTGFCGLGAEMDFFYDGGKMVRPTTELIKKYTTGVLNFLKSNDSIDFILLQEVDKNSARTKNQNEIDFIQKKLPKYSTSFGTNYKVRFVPLPFTNPLGKVEMGQMNLSTSRPELAQRFSFFSAYAWPKRLFMLDRCFVVSRFKLKNGKELIVINTHNSAYDAGGKLREQEMPIIRALMVSEFEKGNYVVAGGDWNQNPPQLKTEKIDTTFTAVKGVELDDSVFPNDWNIVYDELKPTNREISAPLKIGKTKVTIIDYFVLSPNIQIEKIKTFSQNFKYSDHEPVFLKIKLR